MSYGPAFEALWVQIEKRLKVFEKGLRVNLGTQAYGSLPPRNLPPAGGGGGDPGVVNLSDDDPEDVTTSAADSGDGDDVSRGNHVHHYNGNALLLQGRALAATAPTDTYVITWDAGGNTWKPAAGSGGFSSPLTTRGDILTRDASTHVRLAVGTSGRYLRSNGTDPSWSALLFADVTYTGLSAGNILRATGSTAASFGSVVLSDTATFTGQLLLSQGGTGADLSATGPGIPRQLTSGANFTVGDVPFALLDFTAAGSATGEVLIYDIGGTASFGPLDLANVDATAGLLLASKGGTGINNSTRTLTISTNAGTLAFSAAASTLTIPATGTAALGTGTSGRVTFWSGTNAVSSDGALLWDNTNKRLNIGAAPSSPAGLGVAFTDPENASTLSLGSFVEFATNPGATALSTSKRAQGFSVTLSGSGGGASGLLFGVVGNAINAQSAGTLGSAFGSSYGVRATGAGSITAGTGVAAVPVLSSSGNIVTWHAFDANSPSISSSGTITTAVAFYATKQAVTGVTTGYGFYQADAADLNFFAGGLIMAEITAPGAPGANQGFLYLDDNGAGKTRLNIRFATGAVQVIATQP